MKQRISYVTGTVVFIVYLLIIGATVVAQSNGSISSSYESDQAIKTGSIVSLKDGSTSAVERADVDKSKRTIGVVVRETESIVEVNPVNTKVQVASSGTVDVLVSNVNGPIKQGDRIAVSPLAGIGMKSALGDYVVGFASRDFTGSEDDNTSTSLKRDNSSESVSVKIGYIPVTLAIGIDNNTAAVENITGVQAFVRSLTGRIVSLPRIIASLVIAIVALGSLITLIYASTYGSLISIGRNPLAKKAILRALTIVLSAAIFGVFAALFIIMLLLR